MEKFLSFLGMDLSYCNQCGMPAAVGKFVITGWKHSFYLCDVCLKKLSSLLVSEGEAFLRKNIL